jgi:hypothetical protein
VRAGLLQRFNDLVTGALIVEFLGEVRIHLEGHAALLDE